MYSAVLIVAHCRRIFSVRSRNAVEFELKFAVDPAHFQSANFEYTGIPLAEGR